MHYQKDTHYWTASHPCGDIDLTGAVLLPKHVADAAGDAHARLRHGRGEQERRRTADGHFRQARTTTAWAASRQQVTYEIPAGANAFKAVVALDDAQADEDAKASL